jgi:ppGpp synthetase/RelA/SpoT-type nucleotidyltranferase
LRDAADQIKAYLRELMNEASIPVYNIECRAKSLDSYAQKAVKTLEDGSAKYPNPATSISDCVAARIIVFTNVARERASEQIRSSCGTVEDHNPGDKKLNGYDSQHFVVDGVLDPGVEGRLKELAWYLNTRPGFEVQVRTVAAHAWAEYEHDVRYKPSGYRDLPGSMREKVDQLFVEAGGLRKYLDQTFNEIDAVLSQEDVETPDADDAGEIETGGDTSGALTDEALLEFMGGRYPDSEAASTEEITQLVAQLHATGLSTVGALEAAMSSVDADHVFALMDYQVPPTQGRRLDDELLAARGEKYVLATPHDREDRARLLRLRLKRVQGKTLIYRIEGEPSIGERYFSAARTFREMVKIVAMKGGVDAALLEGAVSQENDLDPSTRAVRIDTDAGGLWVSTNLKRSTAEEYCAELLKRVPGSGLKVLRAGDVILKAPGEPEPAA